jgi:hypothetical protein
MAALGGHLKNRVEDGHQLIPWDDDDKRPSKGELRKWKQGFINATIARMHFMIEEAKKELRKEWEPEKKDLLKELRHWKNGSDARRRLRVTGHTEILWRER